MSGVFQNIDQPPHRPASVYPSPLPLVRGEDTLAVWREGGGSIVRKTPDTALYSTYICKYFVQWCKYFVPKTCVMGASGVEYLYLDCGVVGGPGGGALYLVS
jgi:hypothetical protein